MTVNRSCDLQILQSLYVSAYMVSYNSFRHPVPIHSDIGFDKNINRLETVQWNSSRTGIIVETQYFSFFCQGDFVSMILLKKGYRR